MPPNVRQFNWEKFPNFCWEAEEQAKKQSLDGFGKTPTRVPDR